MIGTVLVLPSPPALLAPTSVTDPVAELRAACQDAVAGLPPGQKVIVLANPVSEPNAERGIGEPLGHRVARSVLGEVELNLSWSSRTPQRHYSSSPNRRRCS